MSPITTHVLDTAIGRPAKGVKVELGFFESDIWKTLGTGETDDNGRCTSLLLDQHPLKTGRYRMTFKTESYFGAQKVKFFYPYIEIVFSLEKPGEHYHIPLLLSPFGYSTYRGS